MITNNPMQLFDYAKDISFENIIKNIRNILTSLNLDK